MTVTPYYRLACEVPSGPGSVHNCVRILTVQAATVPAARRIAKGNRWRYVRGIGDVCPLHPEITGGGRLVPKPGSRYGVVPEGTLMRGNG